MKKQKYNLTRETLIIRLQSQYNDDAWTEFHNIYSGFIHAILFKMNVNPANKDDLAQDILLKAWKNIPKFEFNHKRGKFRNWLGMISSNTVKNYYRSEGNRNKLINDGKLDIVTFSEPEIDSLTEQEWRRFIAKMAWENVSQTLSEPVRKCYELVSEGMSPDEISTKLDISYNSVCVYKNRVTNKMSCEISRLEQELG